MLTDLRNVRKDVIITFTTNAESIEGLSNGIISGESSKFTCSPFRQTFVYSCRPANLPAFAANTDCDKMGFYAMDAADKPAREGVIHVWCLSVNRTSRGARNAVLNMKSIM